MSIEYLKNNIEHERKLINEIYIFYEWLNKIYDSNESRLVFNLINSLINQLKILDNSLPGLVNNIHIVKDLSQESGEAAGKENVNKRVAEGIVGVSYSHPFSSEEEKTLIAIKKSDRIDFLKELSISEESLNRIKKRAPFKAKKRQPEERFVEPGLFLKLSNRLFLNFSERISEKKFFKKLKEDLRKSNMYILLNTYISLMIFSSVLAFIASFIIFIFISLFSVSMAFPFISFAKGDILIRILYAILIPIFVPILTFFMFYFYPSTEKNTIARKINTELPFVAIHMSAVASSDIPPLKVFQIIATSEEYPSTSKEIRKLINEVNVYGFDLVTALKNLAKSTGSIKLAELMNGLSITITSGGSLQSFLNKRAESLLFEYKLERQKYAKVTELFMDIYISLIIAAPMILMMMLVLISVSGIGFGLGLDTLTFLIVSLVAFVNIIFLAVLHFKQPEF
jgi:flagellar protein FlaJ